MSVYIVVIVAYIRLCNRSIFIWCVSLSLCESMCWIQHFWLFWEFGRTKWITMSHIYVAYVRMEYQHQRNWLSCHSFQYPLYGLIEEVGSTDGAFYSHRWQSNSCVYVCLYRSFSLCLSPMLVCVSLYTVVVCKFLLSFQSNQTMYSILYFRQLGVRMYRSQSLCVCAF